MSRRSKKNTACKATHKAASTATAQGASRAASKAACHFLRLPIEIRFRIYGYLLLDPPRADLDPNFYDGMARNSGLEDEDTKPYGIVYSSDSCSGLDFEDDMLDFGGFNPYGIPMGDMCDGMFNEFYNGYGPTDFMLDDMLDPLSSGFTDDEYEGYDKGGRGTSLSGKEVQRHLAILRTSRQIYNEASALLYSDLTIHVNPGDAVTDMPGNSIVEQIKGIWRHAPSKDFGSTDINGRMLYKSCLLDGLVEPHVFARFEKVSYYADFSFDFHSTGPSLYINDDLSVRAEDAARFVSYLTTAKSTTRWFEDPISSRFDNGRRETFKDVAGITISSVTITEPSTADIIQKFVDLLSNSPLIRHLEVILNLEVGLPDSLEDISVDSDSDSDSEQEVKGAEKTIEKTEVASERGTELFLESGVLHCLRKLSNIKQFSLEVATRGRGNKVMKLQQKHSNIVRILKEGIEKNWMVKHGSR